MKSELNYVRVILCLLIIMTHILTQYSLNTDPDNDQIQTLYWFRNIIIVATPGFIILSELLTTLNYKDKLPGNYLWQRIKYIIVPYLIIGLFYTYGESRLYDLNVREEVLANVVLGNWYGYFVLVIAQFFILNIIIYKISPKILDSKILLVLSFIVTFGFLYSYYNVEAVYNLMQYYPFSENTFILGWIFFYFFGAYIGRNYETIKAFLKTQSALIVLSMIAAFALFVYLSDGDYWNVTSFHYSLTLFHTVSFLMIIYVAIQLSGFVKRSIMLISRYSFFIFLFHPIILPFIYDYTAAYADLTIIFICLTTLFVVGVSVGTGLLLSQFSIFKFVIGKQPYKKLDYAVIQNDLSEN
jgi:membrane-bound acyltransferase YfiQ involved in biofilm formation